MLLFRETQGKQKPCVPHGKFEGISLSRAFSSHNMDRALLDLDHLLLHESQDELTGATTFTVGAHGNLPK
jgi:hypothetical protein